MKNKSAIEPWLSIPNGEDAVTFYKSAFGATEGYRLNNPDGSLVVKLLINEAAFWINGAAGSSTNGEAQPLGGESVRLILINDDPVAFFSKALAAGATEIFAVGEDHGWKLGRLADPFGLHWEVGYQL